MKLVEKAHAAGRVAEHISAVRLGAQNELVQYRKQQSLHELWCQSPFGNHRPPLKRRQIEKRVEAIRSACFAFERDLADFKDAQATLTLQARWQHCRRLARGSSWHDATVADPDTRDTVGSDTVAEQAAPSDTVAPLDAVEKPAGDTVAPLDAVENPLATPSLRPTCSQTHFP